MDAILKNFIVFEGIDGSGTSTQLKLLADEGLYTTAEPTDGSIGKLLRLALKKEGFLSQKAIAHLFAADRSEHLYGVNGIIDRCKAHNIVICDRYVLSSLVYQGLSCSPELAMSLNFHFPVPQVLIFFDIDPKIAEKRLGERKFREIYENLDFQIKVRERYLELLSFFKQNGSIVEIIDATLSIEEVHRQIHEIIERCR
jgi:dTMP kinase